MPSKKKKYNARFPPARIKKIMQTDEDVGKVAAAVPVIISRSLELFIESFIQKTAAITKGRNAKTLSAAHIKQTIHSEKTFDFLRDLVANVPDHQPEEDGDSLCSAPSSSTAPEVKKPKVQRPKKEKTGNGRGRPRKKDVVKEEIPEKEEKEETESEDDDEDDEEGSDTDSSQTNTEQSQPGAETSQTHPLIMQTPLQSGSHDAETTVSSDMQTNPAFDSASGSASVMAPSFSQHNPMSPRLSQLQSPSQFPNMGMMPLPQIQNIPHPQFQTGPNQMLPSQHQYSGLTNQIPPPPSLTNFSNQLPVQQNFYPAHMSQIYQYPIVNSQETFHSDQKPSFMMSRETPPFSSTVSQFSPQVNQKELNPGNSYLNNVQNNEPLDMSKSSHSQRSPATNHESVPGKSKGMPSSFAGLTNIMNMTVPKPVTDDDDYDT